MKIRREECVIIGGMRAARGGAAFARAPVVVDCNGKRYIVRRIGHGEELKGEPMSDAEWRGVLASEEALELSQSHRATPNTVLWLLRRNFWFRDQAMDTLRQHKAVLHIERPDGTFVVLVDESAASGLTDVWAGRAFNQAWPWAEAARLSEAVEAAELAMDLTRRVQPDHIALLGLLYERLGDKERAEAYMEMARNTYGDAFYERAREKKERFARELALLNASAPRRPRFAARQSTGLSSALRDSFTPFYREVTG